MKKMASVAAAGVIGLATGGFVRHLVGDKKCDLQGQYNAGFSDASATCIDPQAEYDAGFAAALATCSDPQAQYDAGFAAGSGTCSDPQERYDAGFIAGSETCIDPQVRYDEGFAAGQSDNSNKCKFTLEKNQPSTAVNTPNGVVWSNWSYGTPSEYTLKRDEINQQWVGASRTVDGTYAQSQYRITVTPYDNNNFECCLQTTKSHDDSNPTSWQTNEACYSNTTTFMSTQNSSAVFVSMYAKKL